MLHAARIKRFIFATSDMPRIRPVDSAVTWVFPYFGSIAFYIFDDAFGNVSPASHSYQRRATRFLKTEFARGHAAG